MGRVTSTTSHNKESNSTRALCLGQLETFVEQQVMNFTNNETVFEESFQTLESFTRGLYTFGIPVICIFGIVGNLLSFKVFMFTSLGNQGSSTYICALSLSDTTFLTSLMLSWLGHGRIGWKYGSSPVWCHCMIYVTYVCSFLSVWYVVLIMIDRYIVVCHSLRVPEWCTKRRSRLSTAIVTIFGLVFYSHSFFTADVVGDNCGIRFKPFMLKILYYFIYTDTAITFIIPFAIIFVFNVIVIVSIRRFQVRHVRIRKDGNAAATNALSKAQFRITRTFTLVSAVLLITNVPSHGIRFYIIVNQLIQVQNILLIYAQHVFQILYYANFAVNFLLYSVSSKKFRTYLSHKYCCYLWYKRKRLQRNHHLYQ